MTFMVLLTKSIVFDVLIRVKVIRVGNDFESTSHEKYVFFAGRPVDLSIIIYQLMQEQYRFIYVVNCNEHLVITSIISIYILVKVPSLRGLYFKLTNKTLFPKEGCYCQFPQYPISKRPPFLQLKGIIAIFPRKSDHRSSKNFGSLIPLTTTQQAKVSADSRVTTQHQDL